MGTSQRKKTARGNGEAEFAVLRIADLKPHPENPNVLGSGSTLIAAERLGRRCFGVEIEPRYVDVTVNRWQTMTGQRATLESTGEEFPA